MTFTSRTHFIHSIYASMHTPLSFFNPILSSISGNYIAWPYPVYTFSTPYRHCTNSIATSSPTPKGLESTVRKYPQTSEKIRVLIIFQGA